MKKRIIAILLCMFLLLGNVSYMEMTVIADSQEEQTAEFQWEMLNGRIKSETKNIPDTLITEERLYKKEDERTKSLKRAVPLGKEWDQYKSYYFYNQLTQSEKEFYDALDDMCMTYLTTYIDGYDYDERESYMDFVSKGSLSSEEAMRIMDIFRMSNPQYFFITTVQWNSDRYNVVTFGIYRAFSDGSDRQSAKAVLQKQLIQWENQITEGATDEEKVKIVHDIIVDKVTYDYSLIEDWQNFDDETSFSQSIYSVFCMDKTVCAGYSQSFTMLCNGAGIDAVSVTSENHQWNKVRINDSWYNVDCTWDDAGDEGLYLFFERNDYFIENFDEQSKTDHTPEKKWEDILPVCSLDSEPPNWYTAGILPTITEVTVTPEISIKYNNGKNIVTITSDTQDVKIYFSLDGTNPSPASVKCNVYKGPLTLQEGEVIKAVAVCDAKLDSKIMSMNCIVFDGNGADSGDVADVFYESAADIRLPANQFVRKGYVFTGWNTKSNGSGTAYASQQIISKAILETTPKLKLYAQWKSVVYSIKYKLNGGKNNSSNPSSYMVMDTIKLKNPTRKGYTFQGWYTDSSYKNKVTGITAGSTGAKTLYAKWTANQYKIVFKGNGSKKGKMATLKKRKYGVTYKLPANKFKRKGYKFKGWSTKANGKGKKYKNKQKVKNLTSKAGKKIVLYAIWKKKK